jgi:site-specific recombinase XerD
MPVTVMHRLCTLRSFYRYCEDEGYVDRSPAAKVRLPKVSQDSSTHGMTGQEAMQFLAVGGRGFESRS